MPPQQYILEISGPMACFTRSELKVERVSYEVIISSAARAIFEAVYWKPQIAWRVVRVEVLSPIAFTYIRRCEVASMANGRKEEIIADDHRQLRGSLVLRLSLNDQGRFALGYFHQRQTYFLKKENDGQDHREQA